MGHSILYLFNLASRNLVKSNTALVSKRKDTRGSRQAKTASKQLNKISVFNYLMKVYLQKIKISFFHQIHLIIMNRKEDLALLISSSYCASEAEGDRQNKCFLPDRNPFPCSSLHHTDLFRQVRGLSQMSAFQASALTHSVLP